MVESVGGRTGYAYEIAKIIYRRNADLVIENECSSACFEFFVPVARTVVAIGDPVIAVHGNPVMLSLLLEKDGYEYKTNCRWEALEFLDTVYASKGLNKGYHAKALSMLGEVDVEYSLKTDGCLDSFEMNSEIKFWEPTSDEIERFLGVEIIGEICRDSIGSCI